MAGWAGFSDEELRSLKTQKELPHSVARPRKQPSAALSRQQIQRRKALQAQNEILVKQDGALSTKSVPSSIGESQDKVKAGSQDLCTSGDSQELGTEQNEEITKKELELKHKPGLGQLQLEQRLIEEKNKRKRALLAKAIAERSKKTQAEAIKLKRIQKQLQALDDLVSTDIGILRNRIDQACVEFSHAKKRFDKAESEYISAKLDLHKKTEIKEQLTEHLCTIIQENEIRKAKKLEELMQQLEVETDEEQLELEIEVERLLQHQEAEPQTQLLAPQEEKSRNHEENIQTSSEKDTSKDNIFTQSEHCKSIDQKHNVQENKSAPGGQVTIT
ncbi:RAB6-interacting golgin [Spea bombifrons]|uniref:RAB6-interacting golgin n=1 Tax=Spea bombifrons TaxID=233779 RepID=UPI00234B1FA1|nr:RAB6-interacting golgin [Spea bombifrons]